MTAALHDVRQVLRLAGLRPGRFALAVLLGVVASLAGIGLLALSGYLICRSSQQPPILSLTVVIVLVRALAIARPLGRYLERLTSHDLAFRSLGRLRAAVFARVEPLAPAELEHYRDGELLSRLVRDVDELQDLVLRLLLPAAVAAVVVPVVVVGAAVALPAAGALLLGGLLLASTVVPLVAHRLTVRGQARQAALRGELTAELLDALDAAPELWLYGADAEARERLAAADAALAAANRDDARGAGWADALGVGITGLTTVAVLGAATAAAGAGSLNPLYVAPLALVAAASFDVVAPLGVAGRHVGRVLAAARRVLELTARRPHVVDPEQPAGGPARHPEVRVRDLAVVRGADRHVALELPGLVVAGGERVVVSGPSGAGKSTLLGVLARFLERERGSVALDGLDVRDLAQERVRAEVLLSEQDPHVFASSIRENVAFARPGCDDHEVLAALDRAQLGEWVRSLPEGIHTMVGERGRDLSGGQRQRLAMARAFLADPSVLLLDEPTAHLDGATATALLADLWATAADRSVVLVTHDDPGAFADCRRVEVVPPGAPRAGAPQPAG